MKINTEVQERRVFTKSLTTKDYKHVLPVQ